jgi:hypothetical protein
VGIFASLDQDSSYQRARAIADCSIRSSKHKHFKDHVPPAFTLQIHPILSSSDSGLLTLIQ